MYLILKRALDLVFSFIFILVLTPFLLPVILVLKFTGEGYVFYFQKRIGLKRKEFNIIKFATMLKNSPHIGSGDITLRNDPRLLPAGKFLRMTKINELPQLLNVFKGDMSLVGPRPLVAKTFNAYPENIQDCIYDSKPGITGIGSIVFRDEEKLISSSAEPPHDYYKANIAPYKGALELWYLSNKSFLVDIIILFLTGWVIIFPHSKLMYKIFKTLPKRNF